ncbi:hypothetical protein FS842_010401 [Serendipita sp. 407]|nr:hypothetical protein FS842_010401 [Serendipita sp. 407]
MSFNTPSKQEKTGSELSLEDATSIHDASYMRDLARGDVESVIKNCTILSVPVFLDEMMATISQPPPAPAMDANLFKGVPAYEDKKGALEKHMYAPLREGFTAIAQKLSTTLKTNPIACVETYTSMNTIAEEQAFDAEFAPDLYLTLHEGPINALFKARNEAKKKKKVMHVWRESLFHYPGVLIEVKRSAGADFPWVAKKEDTYDAALNGEAKKLLEQIHRYISYAQYPAFPYRFIYCITVTGAYMRFWKWAATGARVSDRIEYRKSPEAVVRFIQALQMGGDPAIGTNVGPGLLFDDYKPPKGMSEKEKFRRAEVIAALYNNKVKPAWEDWLEAAASSGVWQLGSWSQNESITDSYILLQYPIYSTISIFGRGTRCFLAVDRAAFEHKDFDKQDLTSFFHTFKTSWQFIVRSKENDFYTVGDPGNSIKYLASLLGGGVLPNSQQSAAMFVDQVKGRVEQLPLYPEPPIKTRDNSHFYQRELRWVLLKEVGRRLTTVESSGELVQTLRQCLSAYGDIGNNRIIHRDISANNILINITTGEGLLVDLDSAKYMQRSESDKSKVSAAEKRLLQREQEHAKARPVITGTMVFSSIALSRSTIPRWWHDYEAFFWLLVWCTIRHVNGVTLVWADGDLVLINPENRQKALDQVFRYEAARVDEAREQGAKAKLEFLENCVMVLPDNQQLETLINKLRILFKEHYTLIRSLQAVMDAIRRLYRVARKDVPDSFPRSPFSIASEDSVAIYLSEIEEEIKNIPNTTSYAGEEVTAALTRAKAAIQQQGTFPDYHAVEKLFNGLDVNHSPLMDFLPFTPKAKEDDEGGGFKSLF